MVAEGTFREDLYYRINVIPVRLPSLRERVDDIPLLAEHFAARFAAQMGKPITGVSGAAMACLQAYAWPGNIRELENAIERAVALERSPSILVESLPESDCGRIGAHGAVRPRRRTRFRRRVRPRAARAAHRARVHRRGAEAGRRREGARPPSCSA